MNSLDNKNIQIADFLAEKGYLPISKKGANWWYLSPLHNENTASFKVNVDKNVWYDFGLGKGVDLLLWSIYCTIQITFRIIFIILAVLGLHFPQLPKRQGKALKLSAMLK